MGLEYAVIFKVGSKRIVKTVFATNDVRAEEMAFVNLIEQHEQYDLTEEETKKAVLLYSYLA